MNSYLISYILEKKKSSLLIHLEIVVSLQIIEVQTQVSLSTEALKGAQTEMNDLRRQIQTLEIELESQRNLVRNPSQHTLSLLPHSLSTLTFP